jgi:hypothetical protein
MTAAYEQSHAFGGVIDVLEAIGATYAIWGGITNWLQYKDGIPCSLRGGKPHQVVHHVHTVNGVTGALCSPAAKPAEGDETLSGYWELLENLPPKVRICLICQKLKQKLDNPIPERVERELEKLALWDARAADLQRQKMLDYYRHRQKVRS